jgi:hypothetical protein
MPNMPNPFYSPEVVSIGGFPVKKYGCLLQEEADWFEGKKAEQLDQAKAFFTLAKAISDQTGVSDEEALNLVQSLGDATGQNAHLLVRFSDQLDSIKATMKGQYDLTADSVTLVIRSRVDGQWLLDNAEGLKQAFGIEYTGQWLPSHTGRLPRTLVLELSEFLDGEFRQWATPAPAEVKAVDLGESSKTSKSKVKALAPTG